jgi:hypothetical protein
VFLSTNYGTSWTAVNINIENASIRAFSISPDGAGRTNLLVGTFSSVWRHNLSELVEGPYRSHQSGNWNNVNIWERYNGVTWDYPALSIPDSTSGQVNIQSGHTVTVTASTTMDSVFIAPSAVLTINSGVTVTVGFNTNGVNTGICDSGSIIVNGTLANRGNVYTAGSGTITIAGGKYSHDRDGGSIPTATWNTGSVCMVTGAVSASIGNTNQNYYNFTWNCADQTSAYILKWNGNTINGNVRCMNTGTNMLVLVGGTILSSTITINGDVNVVGGILTTTNAILNSNYVVNHYGSINVTGGEFSLTRGIQGTGGTTIWNLHKNLTMANCTTSNSNVNGAKLVFAGTPDTINIAATVVYSNRVNMEVSSGSTIFLGSNSVFSSLIMSGGTIVFNGNTISYGGTYPIVTYAGNIAQVTGAELPTSIAYLNINNSSGVTLGASTTVTGTLTLTSGKLTLGAYNLVASLISGGTSSSYIVTNGAGALTIKDVGSSVVLFPIGTSSSYNPITLNNMGTVDDFSVQVQSVFSHPPYDAQKVVNRQWMIVEKTAGGSIATITFQWNANEQAASFNRGSSLSIGRYNTSSWVESSATLSGSGPYSATAMGFSNFGMFIVCNTSNSISAPSGLTAGFNAPGVELIWTDNSNNETGFTIERKTGASGSYSVLANVASGAFSYHDNSVLNGYTYYYRVYAYNGSGNSEYSNVDSITMSGSNDLTPPNITDNTTLPTEVVVVNNTASPQVTIYAAAYDNESGVSSLRLQYISEGDLAATDSNFTRYDGSEGKQIPMRAFITNDGYARGVSYRLIATNGAGLGLVNSWITIYVKNAPSAVITTPSTLQAASNLPSDQMQKAYRIFSVPYDLQNKRPSNFLPSSLGPHSFNGVNYFYWRFQRFLTSGNQDYEDFKDDQNAISPGKGFFLIVRDSPKRISVGMNNNIVSAVRSDLVNFIGITLQKGWNLLGTPMNMNIPWNSLAFNVNCTGRAYYGDNGPVGGWYTSGPYVDTLRPWGGLAIFTDNAGTVWFNTLGARVSTSDGEAKRDPILAKQSELSANPENWVVRVNAYRSDIDMRCEGSGLGMAQNAKEGYDGFDMYMPPFVGERNIALYFKNADGEMMQDIRPLNEEGGVWEMRVATGDAGARVKLQFGERLNMPNPNFEAYLIDIEQKMAYNLKTISVLEISSNSQGVRDFRVVVGKKSYVEQQSNGVELTPSSMKLYSNYPNPFNPETVIRYTVSDRSPSYAVTLKIYNVLGQEIATLVNEQKPAGYYEVRWNASQQSSGIYFYEISIMDGSQTFRDIKKMVFMK